MNEDNKPKDDGFCCLSVMCCPIFLPCALISCFCTNNFDTTYEMCSITTLWLPTAILLPARICVGCCCCCCPQSKFLCCNWNVNAYRSKFSDGMFSGGTYLHGAAAMGHNGTASFLIFCCCADVNTLGDPTKYTRTPLHDTVTECKEFNNRDRVSSIVGQMEIAKMLMDGGADPMIKNKVRNPIKEGMTLLFLTFLLFSLSVALSPSLYLSVFFLILMTLFFSLFY